ncbi:MAG: hemerythrin domain-containing protein [Chitinispirillaceae bacterium]
MGQELFDRLRSEHEQIKDIVFKMNDTSKEALKARENLLLQLQQILIPHMKAEESVFYPALKDKSQSHDIALEALEEHHVADMVFKELQNTDASHDTWKPKAKVLMELLEHHIEEEESEVFESAEEVFADEQMKDMYRAFQSQEEVIRSRSAA